MDLKENVDLPFEAGQAVESRSFTLGFRGAWFRCKILKYGMRKGQIEHVLEYLDFPDKRITWRRLYQKPSKSKAAKWKLSLRPHFPPVYRESQMPDINSILEVVVIVDDVWKVGDLVDWFSDGCYWSGRITELLGDEKLKVRKKKIGVLEKRGYTVAARHQVQVAGSTTFKHLRRAYHEECTRKGVDVSFFDHTGETIGERPQQMSPIEREGLGFRNTLAHPSRTHPPGSHYPGQLLSLYALHFPC